MLFLSKSRCCPAVADGLEPDGLKSFAVGRYAPVVPAGHKTPREGILSEGQPAEGNRAAIWVQQKDFNPSRAARVPATRFGQEQNVFQVQPLDLTVAIGDVLINITSEIPQPTPTRRFRLSCQQRDAPVRLEVR